MASLCKNVKCEQWRQQGFCYCDHTFTVFIILSSLSNSLLCSLLIASFSRIPWVFRVFLFQLPRTPISDVNFCHSKESLLKEEKSENYISLFFFFSYSAWFWSMVFFGILLETLKTKLSLKLKSKRTNYVTISFSWWTETSYWMLLVTKIN